MSEQRKYTPGEFKFHLKSLDMSKKGTDRVSARMIRQLIIELMVLERKMAMVLKARMKDDYKEPEKSGFEVDMADLVVQVEREEAEGDFLPQ